MKIVITKGKGIGQTLLSAFDAALIDSGIANCNLISLSSIIPPHAELYREKYVTPDEDYGNRLYVVKAEMRGNQKGKYIGAVVGWYQLPGGEGLFVEHEITEDSEENVKKILTRDVTNSLTDLCNSRKYPIPEEGFNMELCITQVTDTPTCVLVLAVYKAEKW